MNLQDTIYNTKIIYVYVNNFDYGKNQMGKEQASGHPKSKKVYRAIFNTDTNSYRVVYDIKGGNVYSVFIENLQSKDGEELGYTCDIVPITKSNILDFKISEENLDELLTWLKTDNKDIKEILGDVGTTKKAAKKTEKQQPVAISKKGANGGIPPEFVSFMNLMQEIYKTDQMTFGTIFDLVLYLVDHPGADSGNLGMHWLRMDKDQGAGVNVASAVEKLSRYIGSDRRTNLMNDDLMGAVVNLLNERTRRILNQIE